MSDRDGGPRWFGGDLLSTVDASGSGQERLEPDGDVREIDVRLVDTFDGALAGAGRLLLVAGRDLLLFGDSQGPIVQVTAAPGFVAEMEEGPVRDALLPIVSPLRRLVEIGTARMILQRIFLLDEIEKTMARGEAAVLATSPDRTISLLRMEALRGYARPLERALAGLDAAEGVERLSAGAAIATLAPQGAAYDAKPALDLPDDARAFRAANAIIRAHLDVARQNETGIAENTDSEFLHDYRVALRKVRSVVSLFRGVYAPETAVELKARFGALMARTGRLRDLDVYIIERDAYLGLVPPQLRPGLALLFEDFEAERADEHRALAGHLRSKAYRREIKALTRLFEKPGKRLGKGDAAGQRARDLAQRLIWARYRKICAIAGAIDAATPDAEVHRLRIHCKKLRYLMEFFAPFFPADKIDPLVRSLKKLQDTLGTFNDCAVQQAALSGKLRELEGAHDAHRLDIATSLGALLSVLDQRQRKARNRVVASFSAFDAKTTRSGFRDLFKAARAAA
ncbi:CHAD domain-containing protein [Palleronia aestuarii]|nr:CHAD domain-containing protein [Palleronia aestuarii]